MFTSIKLILIRYLYKLPLDWLIANNSGDTDVLQEAKKKLVEELVDLDTLKGMTYEDSQYWGIKWGLAKRLIRDIKRYVREEVD